MSILSTLTKQGILPLFYHSDSQLCIDIISTLYRCGIRSIEFTNRGEQAYENAKTILEKRSLLFPELQLGIGTIKDVHTASKYLEIGVDYLVSPGLVANVAELCNTREILYIPGCMTPTEIISAENLGLELIKIFPGNIVGVQFLASIKEIFSKLLFMPTGGVDTSVDSLQTWFDNGVALVGMGSKLISKEILENRDLLKLEEDTKKVLNIIHTIKTKS